MHLSCVLGAGFLYASLGITAMASTKETAPRPDIFLITIDTLRADHLHCYGYERVKTPALDALARDGIRFEQAFTASPITNTSYASILTGLLPSSHGVTDSGVPLSPANPTLAELLRKQRYHTAAFIGAVILDSKMLAPGFDQGFDFYDNFPEHPTSKSRWGRIERRGMEAVRPAEAWLSQHPTGPHFLRVHLYDPHDHRRTKTTWPSSPATIPIFARGNPGPRRMRYREVGIPPLRLHLIRGTFRQVDNFSTDSWSGCMPPQVLNASTESDIGHGRHPLLDEATAKLFRR